MEAIAAWIGALVALVALYFTWQNTRLVRGQVEIQREQTRIQREQTHIQHQVHVDAVQPYVWFDIREDDRQGQMLEMRLGNSGLTFARNVCVTLLPPLSAYGTPLRGRADDVMRRLEQGVSSLGPGRTVRWSLGIGHEILEEDTAKRHTVTITADGPFGPIEPLEYEINLSDYREMRDDPNGSLHLVRQAIEGVASRFPKSVGDRTPLTVEIVPPEQ